MLVLIKTLEFIKQCEAESKTLKKNGYPRASAIKKSRVVALLDAWARFGTETEDATYGKMRPYIGLIIDFIITLSKDRWALDGINETKKVLDSCCNLL